MINDQKCWINLKQQQLNNISNISFNLIPIFFSQIGPIEQVEANTSSILSEEMPEQPEISIKFEQTSIGMGTLDSPLGDKEMETVQEYEKISERKFKINGFCYYSKGENKRNKSRYFQCTRRVSFIKKCRGSINMTPNLQITKNVGHSCNQVCQITPRQSSKTTQKENCPTLSVGRL